VLEHYWNVFRELAAAPFFAPKLIWGVVPLYFAWTLNELSPAKASFRTAIQTGFTLVWASAQWLANSGVTRVTLSALHAVSVAVTFIVMGVGLAALACGVMRKFPRFGAFLGHTRFSGYFMIMMFPIQAGRLDWTWDRLAAILLFALPVWLLAHLLFLPLRK